jgi:ABC-type multidrug transport system fused ATPase/permease subunit
MAHPIIFAATVLLGIITQGMGTAISLFLMFIIDSIMENNMAGLLTAAYLGAGVVAVFFISLVAYTRSCILYSYKTVFRMKNDIFSAVLGTKISDFNQSNSAKHISIINNDIKMVDEKYFQSILALSKDISTMLFALGAMAFLSPVNALIALVLSSSPLVLPAIFGNKLSSTNMAYMGKMAILNEKVKDFLSGFEVIKTFGIEKNIQERFFNSALESEKSRYEAGKVNVSVGAFSGTIIVATQILTYLVAGYFVITGSITIGAVIAIAGLSGSIMTPIQYVSLNIANIKATKEIRDGLFNVMQQPMGSLIRDKEADFTGGIILKNLSFKYIALKERKEPGKKPSKPKIRMLTPKPGQSVDDILIEMGIDKSEATILDSSTMNPKALENIFNDPENALDNFKGEASASPQIVSHKGDIPMTESGDLDIAAILAANGITDVDLSQVKVFQADNLNSIPSGLFSPPETPPGAVLKNVSYTFKPGGKYAVVGGSGSGKSTLLRILMGYYDSYMGNVLIGENEIRDINRESLYKPLSMMHQNVFMLDDTLRNNITLYNPYPDEDFTRAVNMAQLGELMDSLPQGSETKIGEGGNTLSGGERQRVAIARALIKGSEVIILDEATANLDNEIAYDIEKSLLETPGLTCIFATHRYTRELLRQCNEILVLRDGELVENGTFDELYDRKEYFYSLYNVSER